MKRVAFFCVLLLAAASMVGASWYGRRESLDASTSHTRKVLYYIDPMHPAYKSDQPGKAPDCGMALEPVYEGSSQTASRASDLDQGVRVRPDTQRLVGVRVQAVEKMSGTERLRL